MDTVLTTALSSPATQKAEEISAERFDEIMRQHQRRVYRVIFLLVRDADTADTLTQECFLRAYQKRASFRGECRIETWILRIAVNLVRDHGKSRRASFWKRIGVAWKMARSNDTEPRQFPAPRALGGTRAAGARRTGSRVERSVFAFAAAARHFLPAL